jgi:antitoxin component of MazEF toxin-antitoxin module
MRVGKRGDSPLARLLTAVIGALGLREGDEVEAAGTRTVVVAPVGTHADAIACLLALGRPLPPGFSFSRDEANGRGE